VSNALLREKSDDAEADDARATTTGRLVDEDVDARATRGRATAVVERCAASMMRGLDYQTREWITEDFTRLLMNSVEECVE
jgi:hypothetical protein